MANHGKQVIYNGYTLQNVEMKGMTKSPIFTSAGTLKGYAVSFTVRGFVHCTTSGAYTTAIAAIAAAYEEDGKTFYIKDAASSAVTLHSFASTDIIGGKGPSVKYVIGDGIGYNFYLDVTVSGNIPPTGSGSTVDDYEDTLTKDQTGLVVWARKGTQRTATAWANYEAAMTATDHSPSAAEWEIVSHSGTLDEDKKEFDYTIIYTQFWKKLPATFKRVKYNVSTSDDGRRKDVTFSVTASPEFKTGGVTGFADKVKAWAIGELPSGTKTTNVTIGEAQRDGSVTVTVTGITPTSGDIIEWTQQTARIGNIRHHINVPYNGAAPWVVKTSGIISSSRVSGRIVGLSSYHDVDIQLPDNSLDWEFTRHDPIMGPDGNVIYAVDYNYIVLENLASGGASGGGVGAGKAGSKSGKTGSWSPGVLTVGEVGGFSTSGLINANVSGFSTGGLLASVLAK